MDPKTRSIVVGAIALIILASLLGSIYYLTKVSKKITPTQNSTDSLSRLPVSSVSSSPKTGGSNTADNTTKLFVGQNVLFNYPKNWGLLTCSNSNNFEFDPLNGTDVKNVVCDVAIKPITILVGSNQACDGEKVKIGNLEVTKSKTELGSGDINYRWCVSVGDKNWDITHRVSASGSRATSTEDFSKAVEDLISKLQPAPQGS